MKIFFHQLEYIITNVSILLNYPCFSLTSRRREPTYSSNKSSDEEESLTECPARVKRHIVSG